MKRFRKYLAAVGSTLAALWVYYLAVVSPQPDVVVSRGPVLEPVSTTEYRVVCDYETTVSNYVICVSSNFVFDGASIPRSLWSSLGLEPFSGTVVRGALVHDALYASHLAARDLADALLYVAILEDKTNPRKARAVFRAVSDWGWRSYYDRTTTSVESAARLVSIQEKRP